SNAQHEATRVLQRAQRDVGLSGQAVYFLVIELTDGHQPILQSSLVLHVAASRARLLCNGQQNTQPAAGSEHQASARPPCGAATSLMLQKFPPRQPPHSRLPRPGYCCSSI